MPARIVGEVDPYGRASWCKTSSLEAAPRQVARFHAGFVFRGQHHTTLVVVIGNANVLHFGEEFAAIAKPARDDYQVTGLNDLPARSTSARQSGAAVGISGLSLPAPPDADQALADGAVAMAWACIDFAAGAEIGGADGSRSLTCRAGK